MKYYCKNEVTEAKSILRSVDAILKNGNDVYFIEFKNKTVDNKTVYELKEKCYDSIFVYFDKSKQSIEESRQSFHFILITNYSKNKNMFNSLDKIKQNVRNNANTELKKIIDKFECFYLKSVKVWDPGTFNQFLAAKKSL
ncbi:MAG: hypothetical protein GX362_04720 [Methanosarcinaceae archaeon]|nr:hypothetical protein [Methanosarcinaceae archaeon]